MTDVQERIRALAGSCERRRAEGVKRLKEAVAASRPTGRFSMVLKGYLGETVGCCFEYELSFDLTARVLLWWLESAPASEVPAFFLGDAIGFMKERGLWSEAASEFLWMEGPANPNRGGME